MNNINDVAAFLKSDTVSFGGIIPRSLVSGIISNSFWPLDNSTNKFHYATLKICESHHD